MAEGNEPVRERYQLRWELVKAFRQQRGAEGIAIFIFGGIDGEIFRQWVLVFESRQRARERVTRDVCWLETAEGAGYTEAGFWGDGASG
jgi:hypothetical protein